jgi:ABC-2 type transport system ATP-binding protein
MNERCLVETQFLTKRYGDVAALDDCTLTVNAGEVFGLLGPNGAGKTTLIRLLLGFLRPTRGTARIDGLDCVDQSVEVRQRVAYLPAEARLFRRMRAKDVLFFFAALRGATGNAQRALGLAARLDLDTSRRVALMSTGMRQKLALAATLSNDTSMVVLDEPTASLDPNVRREVMNIVRELSNEGRTILLSSHVLSEVEEVCDRVVILRGGRLVHTQVMGDLRTKHRVSARCTGRVPEVPASLANRVQVQQSGDRIRIDTEGDLADVLPWLASLSLQSMTVEPFGLRSVYEQYHQTEDVT